ncbi:enoyl-CoA hydratase/isomerase family protein [Mycobacterium sp. M26]|uniref:enoyl-CoA hydratase/isomerase family protein n=1 Tax=Mycobacterium sp. M26 TaxID=1762962 RepID=UPI00073F3BE1|nr:enoyl-CoA hydratase/isomerase family protein [Mycobacterium sp. M26]
MTPVLTEITGAIGRITLNRPDKMNAISIELADALGAAINELGLRDDLNVIVIRGAGGNFCAGGDFDEVQRLRAAGPDQLRTLFTSFKAACDAVSRTDIPVVAAVDGVAAAGGFELMQAVDIVLVSETARISDNHINFGMIPGGGSTARLPRTVGRQQALTLLLSGDKMRGPDALLLGLAQQCFPADQFDESVEAFLQRLAGRDRSAVTAIKRLVSHGLHTDLQTAIDQETDAVVARICGDAGQAGVSAFKNREATV